jgi:hypothetical protein
MERLRSADLSPGTQETAGDFEARDRRAGMDMMESGQAPQLPLAGGQNRSGRVERLAAGDGDAAW